MKRDFSCAARSYDEAAVLAREVGARMARRLDFVKIGPCRMADIGCATGDGIRELQRRYPSALPLAVDFASPMLAAVRHHAPWLQRLRGHAPRLVNADARALPLASGCLDIAWSNLMLHWIDDPLPALRELHRVLAHAGLLTFALLGPNTLKELRDAGATGIRRFPDMHDMGDMLMSVGFADPVMDMEMITLAYASPRGLLRDQRHLGVRDELLGRMGWRDWRRVFNAWSRIDGRLPASFEIVYGHAWKGETTSGRNGRSVVGFYRRPAI